MDTDHPRTARRLHALLGDVIGEFPPHFVTHLERTLASFDTPAPTAPCPATLRLAGEIAGGPSANDSRHPDHRATLTPVLRALAALLEILHAAHVERRDSGGEAFLSEPLVEGLIIAARELVDAAR